MSPALQAWAERLHRQQLAAFPHVARIRTAFAMRAVVPSRGYPL